MTTSAIFVIGCIAALLACVALLRWQEPRYIALWQIIGGVVILSVLILSYIQASTVSFNGLLVVTSVAVGIFAIVAGVRLWRAPSSGTTLSIVAQTLQLAWVSVPGVQFGSTLGPTIGPRITESSITANAGFYGRGGLLVIPGYHFPVDITINVLAVLALIALLRSRHSSDDSAA